MVEVPVIDCVLVVPDRLAGFGPQRERRVAIEVLLVIAGDHEFGRWGGHRRTDVNESEIRVVARDHPGAHVPPSLVGNGAPAVAAGLAGLRDRPLAPQLLARPGIVAGDHAALGPALGLTIAPGD